VGEQVQEERQARKQKEDAPRLLCANEPGSQDWPSPEAQGSEEKAHNEDGDDGVSRELKQTIRRIFH